MPHTPLTPTTPYIPLTFSILASSIKDRRNRFKVGRRYGGNGLIIRYFDYKSRKHEGEWVYTVELDVVLIKPKNKNQP